MTTETTSTTGTGTTSDEPTRTHHLAAAILSALAMLLIEIGSIHCATLNFTPVTFLVFIALAGVGMWNADLALTKSEGALQSATAQMAGASVLVVLLSPILLTSAMLAGAL